MKYFTLLGGLFGFLLVFPAALSAGTELGTALRDATLGCMAGGALFRGFRWVMLQHVKQHLSDKARQLRDQAVMPPL